MPGECLDKRRPWQVPVRKHYSFVSSPTERMERNGIHGNGSPEPQSKSHELMKELAQLRARMAEITSTLRQTYGRESVEVRLAENVSASVQRLEAQLAGCTSARFE